MSSSEDAGSEADSTLRASPGSVRTDSDISVQAERAIAMEAPHSAKTIVSYRFTLDREIALLRPAMLTKHNFKVHNVTISDRCLAPSRVLRDALRFFDAYDGIIINELAYTTRTRGYLERMDGEAKVESWAWSAEQVEHASPRNGRSLVMSLVRKVMILLKACVTFLLISSITGFFIRVAVNGS